MSKAPLTIANIGSEEGSAWASAKALPVLKTVSRLWRRLFEPQRRAFDWLPGDQQLVAWLNTDEALARAEATALPLYGAAPEVVKRVHDKAFVLEIARREALGPPELLACILSLESDALRAPDALEQIDRMLAGWPDWARRKFILKPRFGTSGRGRANGTQGRADTPEIRGSLTRLAKRGGAILEPWLDRIEDLSAQLIVQPDASLVMLGTTRQIVSGSGVYRGNRGAVDSKGRVVSESRWDEALREAAVTVAQAAADEGYRGPAGLDSLSYRGFDDGERFRPLVEWNARFTLGTVAIGLVRQSLPQVKQRLGLEPGGRCPFYFALDAPPAGWPESRDRLLLVPLWESGEALRPALVFGADDDALRHLPSGGPAP